ncbi:putative protein OS=Sphingobium scionense OX=1404341 GN=GGQ90_005235 PE=4 SV=1 [Sphingobium scionense]|uniref:Uncharacterized protein n=1 Tax=Sphingobium scionense TaxID=1404341 RepID=A0A7W6PXZ6_9SPHN|nr:hypothetical protein [Sphingobium scionense]
MRSEPDSPLPTHFVVPAQAGIDLPAWSPDASLGDGFPLSRE